MRGAAASKRDDRAARERVDCRLDYDRDEYRKDQSTERAVAPAQAVDDKAPTAIAAAGPYTTAANRTGSNETVISRFAATRTGCRSAITASAARMASSHAEVSGS